MLKDNAAGQILACRSLYNYLELLQKSTIVAGKTTRQALTYNTAGFSGIKRLQTVGLTDFHPLTSAGCSPLTQNACLICASHDDRVKQYSSIITSQGI